MPKSWKKLREFPKTSETLQTHYEELLYKRFMKLLENLRKSSEIFGKLRKRFKSNF